MLLGRVQVLSPEGDKQDLIAKPKSEQQQDPQSELKLEHQQEAEGWAKPTTKPQSKRRQEPGKVEVRGEPEKKPESKQRWCYWNPKRAGFSKGQSSTKRDIRGHHEQTHDDGNEAELDCPISRTNTALPNQSGSTPTEPGRSSTKHSNTKPVGEPKPVDPITVPATVLNKKQVRVCSWNIRRGLILREQEIISLIKQNSINILFLVETDTNEVNVDTDYTIQGFKTIIQNKKDSQTPTRIICLVDEKLSNETTIRMDLTDENFPSLWIELDNNTGTNTICGGFYREWAPLGGIRNIDAQIEAIEIFTDQIERAAAEKKQLIILGDANLCSERWNATNYTHKRIAGEIQETLIQCGLTQVPLGPTYLADRLDENGMEIQSAIDHAYVSQSMMSRTNIQKLDKYWPVSSSKTKLKS